MASNIISRRNFLKSSFLAIGAVGITACGLGISIPVPDSESIQLPSNSYGEKTMNKHTLVTYASAFGSTAEIALEIGKTLGDHGYSSDVIPMTENPQIDGYQNVIIGSAVQNGSWLSEAVDYIKNHQKEINRLPVAIFSVHITNLGGDPASQRNRQSFLESIYPLIKPVKIAFFAGKFDRGGAMLMLPGWIARFIPPLDFRKWKKIRTWAKTVWD